MTRSVLPWYRAFPSDDEAICSHLTLEEDGAYNRLLRLCWMTPGCSLPDDDAWIMRRMRVDKETFERVVRVVIEEFFVRKNGRVSNAAMAQQFEKSSESYKKRSSAGYKGGKSKALKTNKNNSSNALAMLGEPEPEPEPYIREDTDVSSLSSADDDTTIHVDAIAQAVAAYNDAAGASGWPQIRNLNKARRAALKARLGESGGIEGWLAALEKARASPHCNGHNDRGWTVNFDFLTKQSSFAKLMEGNYDAPRVGPIREPACAHTRTGANLVPAGSRFSQRKDPFQRPDGS